MSRQEVITADGEVIEQVSDMAQVSMAVSLSRAEIDQQIAAARQLPRSVDRVMKNVLSLATMDEETAGECMYALPRSGKPIKGPSVRLAEIIQSQWGNNRVAARVVHVDRVEKYIEAEGIFHDLETNSATLARVRRRISTSAGKVFNDDMIIVTGNAACSIAKRNAILGGVPKGIWRKAFEAAEGIVAGNIETLAITKEKLFKAFAAFGVKPELIFLAIGISGPDDVNLSHVPVLRGMYSALKSGEATVEEMFKTARTGGSDGDQRKSMNDGLADLAGADKAEGKKEKAKKGATASEEGKAEGTAESPNKEGVTETAAEADDDFPGDKPSLTEQARQRGAEARAKGMARKAVPPEYRDAARKVEADAWLAGYDEAAKKDKAAKGAE